MAEDRYLNGTQIADAIEKADTEAFAWLLDLEDTHDFEASDAKDLIVSALREYVEKGRPTKEQIEFAIDNCEPPFIEELKNEREFWIADNMRHAILTCVRELKAPQ